MNLLSFDSLPSHKRYQHANNHSQFDICLSVVTFGRRLLLFLSFQNFLVNNCLRRHQGAQNRQNPLKYAKLLNVLLAFHVDAYSCTAYASNLMYITILSVKDLY